MTIEKLLELARANATPEDKERRKQAQKDFEERMRQYDLDYIERHRCGTCGADMINYSHSFTCPWRGSGF